jgi:alpha-ketoglutarate-dependent taurine dioxygenase
MMTQMITNARAWTIASIDEPACWYYPLPDACWLVFEQIRGGQQANPQPLMEIQLRDTVCAICAEALRPVRTVLEAGRGFAIVEGPTERLSAVDAQLLYWIVGHGLGRPFAQNVHGTMLYDVYDSGQDLSQGARFSVTNYESSFHTDNSFGDDILDYVGLLCLQTAKTGGRSQVLSGYAVHNDLLTNHADALATLYEPFHIDRRGGTREGETSTIQFPVMQQHHDELLVRYLRHWIEAGHEKIGVPLSAGQKHALDVMDSVMRRHELHIQFDLKAGQMYFINNRWILHNRTAFADYPELERRRHLVRLWLQAYRS